MKKVKPELFGATDELGRKLPNVGKRRPEKYVGLFYWTWHTSHSRNRVPKNNTEITAKYPEAINDYNHEAWENTPAGYPYFWGEPVYGYYSDLDEFVVRKNAELIANAGVDVIFFDCTNGNFLWDNEYKFLAKVYLKAKKQGLNVPAIAFMLNFCALESSRDMLIRLYDEFYSVKENKDLFFYWDGKPLIMAHPECLHADDPKEKKILDFFTFRHNEPTYFAKDTDFNNDTKWWGWCSVYPQTKFGVREDGSVEQMTVNVAQNANDRGLHAMNTNGGEGVYGRSYAKGDYTYSFDRYGEKFTVDKKTENVSKYGLNFQQQWDYALSVDPDFVFVTGWNELIAGRFENWEGTPNAFPDQFDYEHSRDIEPSKTIVRDNFYYQLVSNIRKFKYEPAEETNKKPVNKAVFPAYSGSGLGRDADGWKGCHYKESPAKNSIVETTVKRTKNGIRFIAKCEADVETADMRLLITTKDATPDNSWEGFSYIVNRVPQEGTVIVERSKGGFDWKEEARGTISVKGNVVTIDVPLTLPEFGFKWIQDTALSGDVMEVYERGLAVPCGRFYYKA